MSNAAFFYLILNATLAQLLRQAWELSGRVLVLNSGSLIYKKARLSDYSFV